MLPVNFTTACFLAKTTPLEWRLRWTWDWPLWATALMVVTAVVWIAMIYSREVSPAGKAARTFLALLRLAAVAIVAIMLAQPTIEWFRMGRPRLVVLVDRSASMETHDARLPDETNDGDDIQRLDWCQSLLTSWIPKWQSTYQLDVVAFDEDFARITADKSSLAETVRSLETASETASTRLGEAVDYALRELPGQAPAAIVVLSDGVTTRGRSLGEAAERAHGLRVPLYTVAVGSENRRPDVALEDLVVEETVFPGDRLTVEASLLATGLAGQSAQVMLREASTQRVLAETSVKLPNDDAVETIRLAVRPTEPGKFPLELFVKPLTGETDLENNVARQTVEVSGERIRVLLVQASPSYEYRALVSLLERDPAVQMRTRLQESDPRFAEVDRAALESFPLTQEELFEYDVVILGDVDPGLLPRSVWPLLRRFVSVHGGGLVCIAGPRFMPTAYRGNSSLQALLPVELKSLNPIRAGGDPLASFSVSPTELGRQTPSLQLGNTLAESEAIWRELPPVSWLLEIEHIKRGAQVLADDPTHSNRSGKQLPVILRHYVGAGEVLLHATDETWRWRWRTDDRYFARYWGQVVRRLGRGRLGAGRQGVLVTTDRTRYIPGDVVRLRVRFRNPTVAPANDAGVTVELTGDVTSRREFKLSRRTGYRGLFETVVRELPPDRYELRLVNPSGSAEASRADFEIRQPPRELARLAADRAVLDTAAAVSGGKSYTMETALRLPSDLPPPRAATLEALPDRPLWNNHAVIGLLVLILTSEWLLRRRWGML